MDASGTAGWRRQMPAASRSWSGARDGVFTSPRNHRSGPFRAARPVCTSRSHRPRSSGAVSGARPRAASTTSYAPEAGRVTGPSTDDGLEAAMLAHAADCPTIVDPDPAHRLECEPFHGSTIGAGPSLSLSRGQFAPRLGGVATALMGWDRRLEGARAG